MPNYAGKVESVAKCTVDRQPVLWKAFLAEYGIKVNPKQNLFTYSDGHRDYQGGSQTQAKEMHKIDVPWSAIS